MSVQCSSVRERSLTPSPLAGEGGSRRAAEGRGGTERSESERGGELIPDLQCSRPLSLACSASISLSRKGRGAFTLLPLAPMPVPPHIKVMSFKARLAVLRQNPALRLVAFILGCVMMIAAPLAGLLPGPGGIFLFAIGLGLALRSSIWAKRRSVELKRKQPKLGGWADWGLRRASPKRRDEVAKRKEGEGSN